MIQNMTIPIVLDGNKGQERSYDLFSRLLKDRIIFLGEEINDYVSNLVVAQLLYLESVDKEAPVYMYVNSPGGTVTSGLAIYDTMRYIKPDVYTTVVGVAASMASILLAAGDKRFAMSHSDIMIHQVAGGASGQNADVQIRAARMKKMNEKLTKIMSELTKQPYEKCLKDMDRDYYMDAEEALEYGIIDEILYKRSDEDEEGNK